jgi:hypothetical protein
MSSTDFDAQRRLQLGQSRQKQKRNEQGLSDAGREDMRDAVGDASQSASAIGDHVKTLLDNQVDNGADVLARFAAATRKAADDLRGDSPQAAQFALGVADRLDDYAGTLRNQSVDDLVQAASAYTRRQPALVFGAAALAGFLTVRTYKNASKNASAARPSHEARAQEHQEQMARQSNG